MPCETFIKEIITRLDQESIAFLRVKISAGKSKNSIDSLLESEEPTLKISISAPPEKGKANREICKFLGKYFHCQCDIISGHTTQTKLIKLYL